MHDLLAPYKEYDSRLREIFAQQPDHPAIARPNVVPLFAGSQQDVKIRARNLSAESEEERQRYLMPLNKADRKPNGAPAVVQSLQEFQTNFQLFSESSLVDMDWSNVVVAGSAVVTSLLPVPPAYNTSKRALREYYHQKFAPASDVDLFLYNMTEEQAVEKIKQIEQRIRDSILTETTTVRTKNAITIASQYPTRHVQIVLRIYRSISEILTGFDVDCSCAAFDGKQLYASPRALAAYMTQINTIDLTRRSPSYENRLSKYSHRGFEVYWPLLDRSRIDPTVFERSFGRTLGLARLLVLEKLPKSTDRDAYVDQRRAERGRPAINRWASSKHKLNGNMKDEHDDEVSEWVETDEVSDYHTFTIPYGPKFHARKIERLLYAKDLLLNAEWNRPKERETALHRHPAFFGNAADVIGDCCGYCPKPATPEEQETADEENKIYVSGDLTFIKDDPGRQAIGSFHPLTDDDWTEMAYVGNTARLCQAIVDHDLEHVQDWLSQEGADPNRRDYTGRAPLHLAVMSSTVEIVQCLIDAGARIVARLVDGKTALHLAALRGNADMVTALLVRSEANEAEEAEKEVAKRKALKTAPREDGDSIGTATSQLEDTNLESDSASTEDDVDMVDDESENADATTENSFVNIKRNQPEQDENMPDDENEDEPDIYDVNVLAWDAPVSPLHLAIANGHTEVVKVLIQDFGADVLLPIKLVHEYNKSARAAILPLVLALQLPSEKAKEMTKILIGLGASPAQADIEHITALHYFAAHGAEVLDTMISANQPAAQRAVKHLSVSGHQYQPIAKSAVQSAIEHGDAASVARLLDLGACPQIDFATYMDSYKSRWEPIGDAERNQTVFQQNMQQPVITAVECEFPSIVLKLLDAGADVNNLTPGGWKALANRNLYSNENAHSLLDAVREKVKELHEFTQKKEDDNGGRYTKIFPPVPLEEDAEYLHDLVPGTYAHWSTSKQLQQAKSNYQRDLKNYESSMASRKEVQGKAEKLAAVKSLLGEFERLESELLKRGGKTFKELHPDVKLPEAQQYNYGYEPEPPKAWKPRLTFQLPDLTDERQAAYIKLFQACWEADLPTVKRLSLAVWDGSQTPLKVAVQDASNFSPFSIAVLRKHFDIAKAILEIAQAQYAPEEKTGHSKYSLQPTDSDDDSSANDDDDAIQIYSEIVGDRFTVENIGEVQNQVKSNVEPLQLIMWSCPVSRFLEEDDLSTTMTSGTGWHGYRGGFRSRRSTGGRAPRKIIKDAANGRTYHVQRAWPTQEDIQVVAKPGNLFQLAIFLEDSDLLQFLLDVGEAYTALNRSADDDTISRFFRFDEQDFLYAISLSRIQLLKEIIKRTGAGIPLDDLVKKSGVEIAKKPKYYQGLSVHGQKRADWAAAGRDTVYQSPHEEHPPLLHAARLAANLESVEWFLSDAAMRCYLEFAENNQNDIRIKNLAKVRGGLQTSINNWLNLRSKLLIHCVILAKTDENSLGLLQHLCKTFPDSLHHKSASGLTPLQLAFSLHRIDMIKILLEAGTDQTCRNHVRDNIVHSVLSRSINQVRPESEDIREIFGLIDRRLLESLFIERTSESPGSATPLARWLYMNRQSGHEGEGEQILRTILEFSKGVELDIINGEGDTPLHAAVRYGADHALRAMLECRPELLFRENATGRTPYEMAEDAHLANEVFKDPPSLPGSVQGNHFRWPRQPRPTSVLAKRPESFVEGPGDERTSNERVWDVCKEFEQKTKGTKRRRIVSLHEANEVAKRLALRKGGRSGRTEGEDAVDGQEQDDVQDEVDAWYNMGFNADRKA